MIKILDGKELSAKLTQRLVRSIGKSSVKPTLLIIQIGDLDRSNTYIEKKKSFGKNIGISVLHKKYKDSVSEKEVISQILKYNADQKIHGIIVQLPIPKKFNTGRIIESISQEKDIDGLTAKNTKLLFDNKEGFVPAATKGIITLLKHSKISLSGKRVVMIGDSALVGRPTALAILNKKATVTICHSKTRDLAGETKRAEILIVAAGHPNLITKNHVSKGQIVIDVGITVTKGKKIIGDVDYKNVSKIVKAITPVPGGVGPMTVFSLFGNLIEAYKKQLD